MTFGLTDNEKYLLKKIELLEKELNRLEWRVFHLEAFDDHPRGLSSISDEEAEELAEDDNFLNDLIDYVNENRGMEPDTLIIE